MGSRKDPFLASLLAVRARLDRINDEPRVIESMLRALAQPSPARSMTAAERSGRGSARSKKVITRSRTTSVRPRGTAE